MVAMSSIVMVGGLAGANAALLAASQTPTSGTALTLTGVQPDQARRILLTYGSEGSARTLVLTGTNQTGGNISETLAVPSGGGGTVASQQDFATVTKALPLGGGWTAAVTLGTNGVASSPWKFTSTYFGPANISVGCIVTGTANYSIEYTYDNPNSYGLIPGVIPTAWPHPTITNKTANADGTFNDPIFAWRLTINSGSGSVTATGIQAGIRN